jgi:hypothetical protein
LLLILTWVTIHSRQLSALPASPCRTAICLSDLSRRSIAEGPGTTLSLPPNPVPVERFAPPDATGAARGRFDPVSRQRRHMLNQCGLLNCIRRGIVSTCGGWRPQSECREAGAEVLAAKLGPEAGLPGTCIVTLHLSKGLLTSPIPLPTRWEWRLETCAFLGLPIDLDRARTAAAIA